MLPIKVREDCSEKANGGNFYVYIYFRLSGIPLYVGMGHGKRWLVHERIATRTPSKHLSRIIIASGGELPKIKIREHMSRQQAIALEIALIAAIGRECDGGPLINLTRGGEGLVNCSPEVKKKMSIGVKKAWSRQDYYDNQVARMKKVTSDPEWIERNRKQATGNKNNLGKKRTLESRAKSSATRLLKYKTDENFCKLMSECHKGIKRSEETKKQISSKLKGRPKSPQTIARMKAAQQRLAAERRAANVVAK